MNKKKVLHIVGDSKFGGGSVIILQLVFEQIASGYDVTVLTTDPEFKEFLTEKNVKVLDLDCIWRSYNLVLDFFGIFKLYKYLKKNRFNLIHTHTTKAGFIGRVAAWLAKVEFIIHTVHGFPFSETSSLVKVKVFSYLEKLLFKISTKVVFVSNYHREWAFQLNIIPSLDSAISICNGVTPISLKCSEERITHEERIIFIGRIVKEKGIFDLFSSYSNLKEKYNDLKLIFIGDGPDLLELKAMADSDPSVIFTGFVKDVTKLIKPNDVFVLPSYREGLSISAIEAQSMGLASVLSDVGGNFEVSDNGNCAVVYRVGILEELTNAIDKVLSNQSLREKLKSSSKANFFKNYTSNRMLQEYSHLYESLTKK